MTLQIPSTEDFAPADYSTLEGLKTHPLWLELSDKQQTFLEQFLLTGNKAESIRAAYDVGSGNGAAAMASKLLKKFEIRSLMAAHRGYTIRTSHVTRSELLSLISDRLRSEGLSQTEFRNLSAIYSELKGWRETLRPRGTRFLKDDAEGEAKPLKPGDDLMRLIQQYEQDEKENR